VSRATLLTVLGLLVGGMATWAQEAPVGSAPDTIRVVAPTVTTPPPTSVTAPRSIHAPIVVFDPATVETLTGEVLGPAPSSQKNAVRFRLRRDRDTVTVQLGPELFLRRQGLQLAAGDRIEVTGSRVKLGGKPVIVAAQVRRGKQVVTLRDPKGKPAWRSWGRP
jgi:hypothetical protein